MRDWRAQVGVKTLFIEPGSPWENGYEESFNGKRRDELLDGEIFYTLREAKIMIEKWRRHYNEVRSHSSLGYKPPAPETIVTRPNTAVTRMPTLSLCEVGKLSNNVIWSTRGKARCITSDPKPDVYNRPTILTCSLIFTKSNFLEIAMRRGENGCGLEALLQSAELWTSIAKVSCRNLFSLQLPTPVARRTSQEYRYEDLQIYVAWVQVQENKSTAMIPAIHSFESRLLALPALMSTKNAEKNVWGLRIFNPIQFGVVASYNSEELIPKSNNISRIQIDGPITSILGLQAQELTSHFPPEILCEKSGNDFLEKELSKMKVDVKSKLTEISTLQSAIEDKQAIINGLKTDNEELKSKKIKPRSRELYYLICAILFVITSVLLIWLNLPVLLQFIPT